MSILKAVRESVDKHERMKPVRVTVEKSHNGGYIAETRQGYGDGIKTVHPNHASVAKHILAMCK